MNENIKTNLSKLDIQDLIKAISSIQPNQTRVEETAQAVANSPVKKESFLDKIGAGIKAILPTAVSFIPGIGGVASKVVSALTGNHDEWFEGYKSAGVTTNEFLKDSLVQRDAISGGASAYEKHSIAAAAAVNFEYLNFCKAIKDDQFPAILAYVRNKCDNVLIDDTDNYWKAFAYASFLTATYYCGKKYLKVVEDYPTNIQQVEIPFAASDPETISQFKGILDNLKDYLKSTVRLPDAWNRYLHWRYGTTFLSDNTQKAGLIHYDPVSYMLGDTEEGGIDGALPKFTTDDVYFGFAQNDQSDLKLFIPSLKSVIDYIKVEIGLCGRAMADLRLAFNSEVISEVEPRHFDIKEYNMRINSVTYSTQKVPRDYNRVVLNSDLKMAPAVQSVTMATLPVDVNPDIQVAGCVTPCIIACRYVYVFIPDVITKRDILRNFKINESHWYKISDLDCTLQGRETYLFGIIQDPNATYDRPIYNAQPVNLKSVFGTIIYTLAASSLQLHYNNTTYNVMTALHNATPMMFAFDSCPLGYDMAFITDDQLRAIQRTALRNLFRGDYKFSNKEQNEQVKDAVKETLSVTKEDL